MTITVNQVRDSERNWLIYSEIIGKLSDEAYSIMRNALDKSTTVWVARRDREVLGFWGVLLPSLISDSVYLWLYTTDKFAENCFVCVRHSQIIVKDLLVDHPIIIGHCINGEDKSIRWLRWLGAKFNRADGGLIPFEIRAA